MAVHAGSEAADWTGLRGTDARGSLWYEIWWGDVNGWFGFWRVIGWVW